MRTPTKLKRRQLIATNSFLHNFANNVLLLLLNLIWRKKNVKQLCFLLPKTTDGYRLLLVVLLLEGMLCDGDMRGGAVKGCTHRARIGEHASSGDVWMGGAYAQVVKILIRGGERAREEHQCWCLCQKRQQQASRGDRWGRQEESLDDDEVWGTTKKRRRR